MKFCYPCAVFLLCMLTACNANLQSDAVGRDDHTKTLVGLQSISENLSVGISYEEAEKVLGRPDYSPTEGKYYYTSTETIYSESQKRELPIGLILDYRDAEGKTTEILQNFWLGQLKDYEQTLSKN